jgi:two-component system, OmpR family, response regulator
MSATVLAVDDEDAITDLVCDALSLAGYRTLRARHGMEALRLLREHPVDLVVLDLTMPNVDGFEVLDRMRAGGDQTPVIIVTAREDRDDVRRGFELGADDFLRKPFSIEELALRVRAVLRRSLPEEPRTLRVGELRVDVATHMATVRHSPVDLSPTEFRLLVALMQEEGRVVAKRRLLVQVWGLDPDSPTTVVETYVSYLRRKLGHAVEIRTVRGVGYALQIPEPGS